MHRPGIATLLFCFSLLLPGRFAGRFSENEPLDESLLESIEPGRSTAGDVTELFGARRSLREPRGRRAERGRSAGAAQRAPRRGAR
ncbi:MAG: hypothetical protein AAGD14_15970, partial [Planctomycetota bacterium]